MVSDTLLGDKAPVLVTRVTDLNNKQKRILKSLGVRGITKLNQENYV